MIPKTFVSYSHDSQAHKKWVLEFATRLRNSGIDAILDQWDLRPGDDVPHFMERGLASCDRVLMICTEQYVAKANAGAGGVGYEKMIVTADLLKTIDSNKVVPIIRQHGSHNVPTFLRSKLYLDFSRDDDLEFAFDELLRTLHGAPLFVKPPIGNKPFAPSGPVERTGDPVLVLMKALVDDFDTHTVDYSLYEEVLDRSGISRVMFDFLIDDAVSKNYIHQDADKDLWLTPKGKRYAVEHNLVSDATPPK